MKIAQDNEETLDSITLEAFTKLQNVTVQDKTAKKRLLQKIRASRRQEALRGQEKSLEVQINPEG